MRFRQRFSQEQAAMRKRWAKRRAQDEQLEAVMLMFEQEFVDLCNRYSLQLDVRGRMIFEFRRKIESRDERKIRTIQGGGWPLL
jgi:hypothetical protein